MLNASRKSETVVESWITYFSVVVDLTGMSHYLMLMLPTHSSHLRVSAASPRSSASLETNVLP
jgi:hypothetical protein